MPTAGRTLSAGEMLVVAPGQNMTVETQPQAARQAPSFDPVTETIRWVRLPAIPKQLAVIRWLDTSNIKKLVEIEMLEGDLFLAVSPREQPDVSLAVRGRKTGALMPTPTGWVAVNHRTLKVHLEVDASLRVVGYGHPLLPGNDDAAMTAGLHIFGSLRPGAPVQNAGETTLVIEQYRTDGAQDWFLPKPARLILPPETSVTTNGGVYDTHHFYIPEPGQTAGPGRINNLPMNPAGEANAGVFANPPDRAADANPAVFK